MHSSLPRILPVDHLKTYRVFPQLVRRINGAVCIQAGDAVARIVVDDAEVANGDDLAVGLEGNAIDVAVESGIRTKLVSGEPAGIDERLGVHNVNPGGRRRTQGAGLARLRKGLTLNQKLLGRPVSHAVIQDRHVEGLGDFARAEGKRVVGGNVVGQRPRGRGQRAVGGGIGDGKTLGGPPVRITGIVIYPPFSLTVVAGGAELQTSHKNCRSRSSRLRRSACWPAHRARCYSNSKWRW